LNSSKKEEGGGLEGVGGGWSLLMWWLLPGEMDIVMGTSWLDGGEWRVHALERTLQ